MTFLASWKAWNGFALYNEKNVNYRKVNLTNEQTLYVEKLSIPDSMSRPAYAP